MIQLEYIFHLQYVSTKKILVILELVQCLLITNGCMLIWHQKIGPDFTEHVPFSWSHSVFVDVPFHFQWLPSLSVCFYRCVLGDFYDLW